MIPDAVLIQRPAIDLPTFVSLCSKALGYSPASAADASRRPLGEAERFLSSLNAMREEKAPAGLPQHLLGHVFYSVLVAAEELDILDILQITSGMPFVVANETVVRGVCLALVSGSLNQWRDAVKNGASESVALNVRGCFGKIMGLFEREGLNVWTDYAKKPLPDQTFLLEDKRK